jgi:hypothetical protein
MEDAMKTDKEKAKEVLKERERAQKGFAVTNDEGEDPLDNPENETERDPRTRAEKVGDAGLAVDLGLKR